jgi:hypothetical protein
MPESARVAQVPAIGMLMIPKTCAGVAIAVIAGRMLWRAPTAARRQAGNGRLTQVMLS